MFVPTYLAALLIHFNYLSKDNLVSIDVILKKNNVYRRDKFGQRNTSQIKEYIRHLVFC